MKTFNGLAVALLFALSLSGCGDRTTVIKKETKFDSNGNEHTKIESTTVETTDRNRVPERDRVIVEEKRDPVVKLGPLEIRK